jgi:LDH2 family malate/lactate/ureidoglycolate dehydrogenase
MRLPSFTATRPTRASEDRPNGLARLPAYIPTLDSGWVDGAAAMVVEDRAPAIVRVDARNGFA